MIVKTPLTTIDCPFADRVRLTDDFIQLKRGRNEVLVHVPIQDAVVMPSELTDEIIGIVIGLMRKRGKCSWGALNGVRKLKQLKRELKGFNSVKGTWK